ncbi:MAG: hypothetical protein ACRDZY_18080 [Acidimicrobiales bacterium]
MARWNRIPPGKGQVVAWQVISAVDRPLYPAAGTALFRFGRDGEQQEWASTVRRFLPRASDVASGVVSPRGLGTAKAAPDAGPAGGQPPGN